MKDVSIVQDVLQKSHADELTDIKSALTRIIDLCHIQLHKINERLEFWPVFMGNRIKSSRF